MRFQSKDANFWDPELGKFDTEHSSFISTTLHDHHNLLVLFILVWPQNLRLFRYVCKADWDLKNIKIPKLNVTSQYESDDPVQAFELGFLRF